MARRLQRPMSETLARRLSVSRMFCGLMSRCTMPRWCSATTPCPASSISCVRSSQHQQRDTMRSAIR